MRKRRKRNSPRRHSSANWHWPDQGLPRFFLALSATPFKKLEAQEEGLLRLLHRWRNEAGRARREIKRIVVVYEAGRDGFWLARWLRARDVEAGVRRPIAGEVDMIAIWRAVDLITDKVPLDLVWNGAEIFNSNLIVPKGDPNAAAAWEFCNFVVQPRPQAEFAMLLPYGPVNPEARALMAEWRLRQTPAWPENEKVAFRHDAAWLAARLAEIRERWSQWLTT
jgi:hypothetical protein